MLVADKRDILTSHNLEKILKELGTVQKLLFNSAQDFSSRVPLKNQAHSGLCN